MSDKKNIIGEKVRELRYKMGMTLKELAQLLGVSFTTIYYWESGRSKPNTHICSSLVKIAKAHDVRISIESLVGGRLAIKKKKRLKK